MKLWELAGDNPDCRISPFAWRVRLALALKKIDYESIPWRFVEKDAIKPFEKVRGCMHCLSMRTVLACCLHLCPAWCVS